MPGEEPVGGVDPRWQRCPGDEIVLTHLEHHANIVPWQFVARQTGAVIKVAPVDDAGNLLLADFERLLGPRTKLVAATHVSNALGTVTPVHEIVELGHRYGARVLIDGAQSIPHIPIDVASLGADFFVFSGHKIFGPTGIGALYATEDALAETPPWQGGGSMIDRVSFERTSYAPAPTRFEAGTPPIVEACALYAAIDYVDAIGLDAIAAHEHALVAAARQALAQIPGVRLFGPTDSAGILSFAVGDVHPHDVATILDEAGVAIRAGHHCAQPLMAHLGVAATARASFGLYSDDDDVAALVRGIERVKRIFG